ncbi:MAG: hypothetical protein K2O00_04825 [Muribaculaceae bacterium]|nr:hypothetical protein [Muribaculaceae bacterium]
MKKLLSIAMSVTIVLCSVVQFHHHDTEGNIYINTFLGELEVGFCHDCSDPGDHFHNECNHNHDEACGDTDNCSMHLDELATHEQYFNFAPIGTQLCVAYINCILAVWHIPRQSVEPDISADVPPLPAAVILPEWLLRGPPAVNAI